MVRFYEIDSDSRLVRCLVRSLTDYYKGGVMGRERGSWPRPAVLVLLLVAVGTAQAQLADYRQQGRSIELMNANGVQMRLTPYGSATVRVQVARRGERHLPDDHYEMVVSHASAATFRIRRKASVLTLAVPGRERLELDVNLSTLALSFRSHGNAIPRLAETSAPRWQDGKVTRAFVLDPNEHFTALGHGYFGRAASLDLQGQRIERNYGSHHGEQAPLLVPFYMSSKGYGVFLNSTARNVFSFGADARYEFGLDTSEGEGRLDYFYIAGQAPRDILRRYVELTGAPRLPPKAMFGLALSDKGHDHESGTPSDENWWKRKILEHRAAGYPLDHVVNDNRWRAGGGERCRSRFEWDRDRFPDPVEYAGWLRAQGLVSTLDFNRCIAQFSAGWQSAFNLPYSDRIDFATSAPDLTSPAFRRWFWDVIYQHSLDPSLGYPGEALWIDEFDEMGAAPRDTRLADSSRFGDMQNYWFFLIAKALVKDGWDKSGLTTRPFVWVRGMGAGAQRYATLWSGDILPTFEEMKLQIRGMQLAGLSGFPFWGHDAGGFYDWERKLGPDAQVYKKWSMAMGSFSPIWKPHGMGESRWPLDRDGDQQQVAHTFSILRYEMMPYIYSMAHEASRTGLPMVRAMLLAYPQFQEAWRHDLQYMWGDDILVAPYTSPGNAQSLWLPPGHWYDFWHPGQREEGGREVQIMPGDEQIAVRVRAGAIITRQRFSPSTAASDASFLRLDVYTGADGRTVLVEDDGKTQRGAVRTTELRYRERQQILRILPSRGGYPGAPVMRAYEINFIGSTASCFTLAGQRLGSEQPAAGMVRLTIPSMDTRRVLTVQPCGT
jgi:alpha-D-xyloside xylohydrolase